MSQEAMSIASVGFKITSLHANYDLDLRDKSFTIKKKKDSLCRELFIYNSRLLQTEFLLEGIGKERKEEKKDDQGFFEIASVKGKRLPLWLSEPKLTATAGSDVVQSGRPIFDDFFQHLWPYIGNNTANVVFQMVKRLWLIRIDQ
ncbi:hypothetical protein TNCV_1620851 [Trichonephila clavipes]|nr:hypothetical protein TNCV_1620851 [Trichonephila clavipes]